MRAGLKSPLFAVLLLASILGNAQVMTKSTTPWHRLSSQDSLILERLEISGPQDDFAPVTAAGSHLFFTSDRHSYEAHASVFDHNENIYISSMIGDSCTPAVKHYFFNADDQTAIAGVSADGNNLYVYKTFGFGDIYVSKIRDGQWKTPVTAGVLVNSNEHEQSIARAGNYLVLSSEREGGVGEHDIYSVLVDENGKYGAFMPVTVLNTTRDEVDVRLSPDGKRLWYSTNGMCDTLGYDIFVSEIDTNGLWQTPERMPAPFNTPSDDRWFFDADSIFLLSSNRPGGLGGEDIYKGKLFYPHVDQVIELPYATGMDTLFVVKTFVEQSQPGDTSHQVITERFEILGNYMDSLGIKEYYAMVQIGAFYGLSITDFKAAYPSLKSMDIITETGIKPNGGKITRFLINKKFTTLQEASQLQDEMISIHKIKDAFVAIYNMTGQRIAIYNSFTREFILLKKQ